MSQEVTRSKIRILEGGLREHTILSSILHSTSQALASHRTVTQVFLGHDGERAPRE